MVFDMKYKKSPRSSVGEDGDNKHHTPAVSVLQAAMNYAENGFEIFPVTPNDKTPLGRLAPNGFKDATDDIEQIERWWADTPNANIGLALDGLIVIDIDGADNLWLNDPKMITLLSSADAMSFTPHGGRHYFYRIPEGKSWSSVNGKLAEHVDVKTGDTGYVVIWPSSIDGKDYRWADTFELTSPNISVPPSAMSSMLDNCCNGKLQKPNTLNKSGNLIPKGQRNDALARLAGSMRRAGMCYDEIFPAISVVNSTRCDPPLPENEVSRIVTSICRYEPDQASVAVIEGHFDQDNGEKSGCALNKWAVRDTTFEAINICDITGETDITYQWDGYLSPGHTTLLTGLWKAGKTTLLAWLYRIMDEGGHLATEVCKSKVLVVTEESHGIWMNRRETVGLKNNLTIISRPFMGKPSMDEWLKLISWLASQVRTQKFDLVVFDTLSTLWPVMKENDAGQVTGALTPLYGITESGAAVLLCHHPRKGDGEEAQGSRGSGALPSFVDCIIELRRYKPSDPIDTRRTLRAYSRFDETLDEVVLNWNPKDGYTTIGTKAESKRADRLLTIIELLVLEPPGLAVDEIRDSWPEDGIPKPSKRTIQGDLKSACESGDVERSGDGKSGSPYRYWSKSHVAHCQGLKGATRQSEQIDDSDQREHEAIMAVEAEEELEND